MAPASVKHQRGISLVVGMIMLVLITLLVVSAFNAADTNQKIVGNMQMRQEAQSSAQQAIEETISTTTFFQNKNSVINAPKEIDVNSDGTNDFRVVVTPNCFRHSPVSTSTLDIAKEQDRPCFGSSSNPNTGIFGASGASASSSESLCSDTWWDIQAVATDQAGTGTTAQANQGVTVRVPRTDADNNCN